MQAVTQPAGEGWSPQSHGGRVVQYPPDPSGKDTAFPPPEYICNDGKVELLAQQTLLHITPVRACSSAALLLASLESPLTRETLNDARHVATAVHGQPRMDRALRSTGRVLVQDGTLCRRDGWGLRL